MGNHADTDLMESYWQDPHATLNQLREHTPVREMNFEIGPTWVVTRYEDVRAGLVDSRLAKDWRASLPAGQRASASPGLPAPLSHMLTSLDPPDHTRLRKLVNHAFTARRMARLRPRIEALTETLLAGLPTDEPVDLVERFAIPLPMEVICELIGVPELDQQDFAHWSMVLMDECPEPLLVEASARLAGYLEKLVTARRRTPDDALLSGLIAASEDGDRMSDEEIIAMAMALLIAGHETSAVFITNSVRVLLTDPAARARLASPESVAPLIEELLRWVSPALNTSLRFATEDLEIGGVEIPRGASVTLSVGAANRDPGRFPDPDLLLPDRDTTGHLAFGHGIHRCLGSALVRLQAEIVLTSLFDRFPHIRAAGTDETLTFRRSVHVHAPRTFPVLLGPPTTP